MYDMHFSITVLLLAVIGHKGSAAGKSVSGSLVRKRISSPDSDEGDDGSVRFEGFVNVYPEIDLSETDYGQTQAKKAEGPSTGDEKEGVFFVGEANIRDDEKELDRKNESFVNAYPEIDLRETDYGQTQAKKAEGPSTGGEKEEVFFVGEADIRYDEKELDRKNGEEEGVTGRSICEYHGMMYRDGEFFERTCNR